MKLSFCMQIIIRISYKLIWALWASNFPTRRYYHYWCTWSSIVKVLKVTTLQYFKKEIRDGVHFLHADKHQSFYKLALLFFMVVARHVQISQNWKLVTFANILRKKCHNCFCILLWCKTFRYFTGVQSCLLQFFPRNLETVNQVAFHKYLKFFRRSFCRFLVLKVFYKNRTYFRWFIKIFENFTLYTELHPPLPCHFQSLYKMHKTMISKRTERAKKILSQIKKHESCSILLRN